MGHFKAVQVNSLASSNDPINKTALKISSNPMHFQFIMCSVFFIQVKERSGRFRLVVCSGFRTYVAYVWLSGCMFNIRELLRQSVIIQGSIESVAVHVSAQLKHILQDTVLDFQDVYNLNSLKKRYV